MVKQVAGSGTEPENRKLVFYSENETLNNTNWEAYTTRDDDDLYTASDSKYHKYGKGGVRAGLSVGSGSDEKGFINSSVNLSEYKYLEICYYSEDPATLEIGNKSISITSTGNPDSITNIALIDISNIENTEIKFYSTGASELITIFYIELMKNVEIEISNENTEGELFK